MKFSINRTEFLTALSVVLKGMSKSSTLPVLAGGIYAQAVGDMLVLESTDLTKSIKYELPALVEEEGRTVFLGNLVSDIVKKLPDAAIHVTEENGQAFITCDAITYDIKTLDADDFPDFPSVEPTQELVLPFPTFASMVKKVSIAVSRDESRVILTGVLIELEGTTLRMVATDSFRLAVAEVELPEYTGEDFNAVISGDFLKELTTLPKSEEPLYLGLTDNQIVARYLNTVLVNRRIAGNYPNYKQLLANSFVTEVFVNKEDLYTALGRVAVVADNGSSVRLTVDLDAPLIQVSSISQDKGSAQQSLSCEGTGENMELGYNFKFLQEGLSVIPTEKVKLCIQSPEKPGVFYAVDGESFLYLLMPMRL